MTARTSSVSPELFPIGTYEVETEDFVYAEAEGLALQARSYRPVGHTGASLPGVVEVHGGAWNLRDRTAGEHYDHALASSGLYVLAVDFRQGPDHHHPAASRDVTAAVRYLRAHAPALAVDPDSIGLIGSSSGGHLALLSGVSPDAEAHQGTAIRLPDGSLSTAGDISARASYVIGLWPVSDPAYRYAYARATGRDELVRFHEAYFVTEAAMHGAAIARVVQSGEAVQPLPAALIVQPGEDANVPRPMTAALLAAYQEAGGYIEYAFFPGEPHGFAHMPSPASDDCIRLMRDFIARRLGAPAARPPSAPTRP